MTLESKARLSGLITQLTFFGLIIFYTLRFFVWAPAPISVWVFYMVLLVGFTPAVLKGTPRPHAWLCFVLLVPFIISILNASTPKLAMLGWIEALLVSILFTSAMLFARWQSQWLRLGRND